MNTTHLLSAALVAATLTLTSPPALAEHPGIIRVDWSDQIGGDEPRAKIELSGPVLRLMTAAAGRAAEFGDLIEQLVLIRVEVYEDLEETIPTKEEAGLQVGGLLSNGWESIVRVREDDDESVDILVLPNGAENIAGVAVFVAEPGELVFVNVAGNLNAAEFGDRFGSLIGPMIRGELEIEDLLSVEEEEHDDDDWDDDEEDEEDWEEDEEDED